MSESGPSGRYRLGAQLGEGGMAEVYLAEDLALARAVAVKCLRSEHRDNAELEAGFRAEAHILAALDHPGAIPVYDAGALDDGATSTP